MICNPPTNLVAIMIAPPHAPGFAQPIPKHAHDALRDRRRISDERTPDLPVPANALDIPRWSPGWDCHAYMATAKPPRQ